jgi:hypothetical protein
MSVGRPASLPRPAARDEIASLDWARHTPSESFSGYRLDPIRWKWERPGLAVALFLTGLAAIRSLHHDVRAIHDLDIISSTNPRQIITVPARGTMRRGGLALRYWFASVVT